jgi:hypothetical protein
MSQSPTTSAATPDVIQDVAPTVVKDGMSHAPVLITEQEVVFSTAAARSPRSATTSRRLIDAIRAAGAALHRPPRDATTRSAAVTSSRPAGPAKWTDYEYPAERRHIGVTGVVCGRRAQPAVVA